MTYWRMTKKAQKHPAIGVDETVLQASYGLSAGVLRIANVSLDTTPLDGSRPRIWDEDLGDKEGLAAPFANTGVLALTNRRLLYFKKAFAIGKPKNLIAEWSFDQVIAIDYCEHDSALMVDFSDGSRGGLHSPKNQWPHILTDAYRKLVGEAGMCRGISNHEWLKS